MVQFSQAIIGSSPQLLIDLVAELGVDDYAPRALASDGIRLYWTDFEKDAIYRSNLDGSNITKLFEHDESIDNPNFLVVLPVPEPTTMALAALTLLLLTTGRDLAPRS